MTDRERLLEQLLTAMTYLYVREHGLSSVVVPRVAATITLVIEKEDIFRHRLRIEEERRADES